MSVPPLLLLLPIFIFITTVECLLPSLPTLRQHHTHLHASSRARLTFPSKSNSKFSSPSLTHSPLPVSLPHPIQSHKRAIYHTLSPDRITALNEAVYLAITAPDGDHYSSESNVKSFSRDDASKLIEIGAVWGSIADHDFDDYENGSNNDEEDEVDENIFYPIGHTKSKSPDQAPQLKSIKYTRILKPSLLPPLTPLKIYYPPRRFPYKLQENSIVHDDPSFLIVDKPGMLPSQPDVSNYIECVQGSVVTLLNSLKKKTGDGGKTKTQTNRNSNALFDVDSESFKTSPLKPLIRPLLCHRLDACVSGLIVLSKTHYSQSIFTKLQRERSVKKVYTALTNDRVDAGVKINYMMVKERGEEVGRGNKGCVFLSGEDGGRRGEDGWVRCILEVISCVEIPPSKLLPSITSASASVATPQLKFYEATVRLVTGRKHQVRAQFSAMGCPIYNDTLYSSMSKRLFDKTLSEEELNLFEEGVKEAVVPKEGIGLRAVSICFGKVVANVREKAWWRC